MCNACKMSNILNEFKDSHAHSTSAHSLLSDSFSNGAVLDWYTDPTKRSKKAQHSEKDILRCTTVTANMVKSCKIPCSLISCWWADPLHHSLLHQSVLPFQPQILVGENIQRTFGHQTFSINILYPHRMTICRSHNVVLWCHILISGTF